MKTFKIKESNNKTLVYPINNLDPDILRAQKLLIINHLKKLKILKQNINDFTLEVVPVTDNQDIPVFWEGYISGDREELNKILLNTENPININYNYEHKIGFHCGNYDDMVLKYGYNSFDYLYYDDYNYTYKSPNWIMEQLIKCIS